MNVVVMGSEGSLMQAVIPHLLECGHVVTGVDRIPPSGRRPYSVYVGDLTNLEVALDVTAGAEFIIQAAAQIYGVRGFHEHGAHILGEDILIHRNALLAAVRNEVRKVVYISSSMVYENVANQPLKEEYTDHSVAPSTCYGLSKFVGERLSTAYFDQFGMPFTIWRPFNIITPYETSRGIQGKSHVFADFIELVVMQRLNPLPVLGDGHQVRCFTWIDEVAKVIASWSLSSVTDNSIFNLGNPEPISMRDLAQLIYTEAMDMNLIPSTGTPLRFASSPAYADDVRVRIPDVSRARDVLGYVAEIDTKLSIRRCLQLCRRGDVTRLT